MTDARPDSETDYRESHQDSDKGRSYDAHYANTSWSSYVWSREQWLLNHILESRFGARDIRLLDFACGTGRIVQFLEARVAESTGVDVSPSMLDQAREKLHKTTLIQADLTREPVLEGRQFDLITSFRFFLNAQPELRLKAMSSLAPLLAPDGVLVFNNHHNSAAPYVCAVHHTRALNPRLGVYKMMSVREMRALASSAGLEIVELLPAGLLRVPKVEFDEKTLRRWDERALRHEWLGRLAEDLVAVCVRR